MTNVWTAFRPDVRGTYVERPNRFVVHVLIDGEIVPAHCPNPGRLTELLFPGDTVILERALGDRKLASTLVAVERRNTGGVTTIPLVSVRANQAVGQLLLPRLFPGAKMMKPEFTLGTSRFDWLVEDAAGKRHLIEVKACSEVEYGTALFPDAPSARAKKHLEELAEWGEREYEPHVIFAVVHGRPRSWGPNVHTDPAFARTLAVLAPRLNLHAAVFETQPDGTTTLVNQDLPIIIPAETSDSGHLIRLDPEETGWKVTVDWLATAFERAAAKGPARRTFAIRGAQDLSAESLAVLEACGAAQIGGTLVYSDDPRTNRAFVDAVMRWRHEGRA